MNKKILAVTLALASFISFTACGTNNGTSSAIPASDVQTDGSSPQVADNKFPDPNKHVTFTLFSDQSWISEDINTIIPQEIERLTGVKIEVTAASDSEQLQLLMSSGDLPDLIMAADPNNQSKLSDSQFCMPWNELIEKYAPDWEIPQVEININTAYSTDDNFYTLKQYFSTVAEIKSSENVGMNYAGFYVRDDIYKAIGEPKTNTAADFEAMLAKVKQDYPSMRPIVLHPRNREFFYSFVGFDAGKPTDENGNFSHMLSDPKYYESLKVVNDFYRKGYINKEDFTYTDDAQYIVAVSDGTAFGVTGYGGPQDSFVYSAAVQTTVPEASFSPIGLMDNFKATSSVTGWAGTFISNNCSDPETAIKLMRWCKTPTGQRVCMIGAEGLDWSDNGDGTITLLQRRIDAMEKGQLDKLYNNFAFVLPSSSWISENRDSYYLPATDHLKAIYDELLQKADFSNVVGLCYPKAGTDESVIGTKLADLNQEYYTKICTAESDELFERYCQELKDEAEKIGVAQYNQYLAETYAKLSEQFGSK